MQPTFVSRRDWLLGAAVAVAAHAARSADSSAAAAAFTLPELPYAESALAPIISATTVSIHYGKHHRGYVDALNRAVAGTPYAAMSLSQIITTTAGRAEQADLYNNAAQAWNHTFYWMSLMKGGGGDPPAALKQRIEAAFGSVDVCKYELQRAAASLLGSGWVWLVQDAGKLAVARTANADSPLLKGQQPLLCIDVWEHAYHSDYQNLRTSYVAAVLEQLVNWEFAAGNLG